MADNEVVKTIENVDALFAQIVVNGEVHESNSYVASEVTTPSSQSQQTTVVEEEEEPEATEATDGVGEDVYAVELNDTLHNFVDRAVGEALQNEIQTRGEADLQLHNSVVSLGQRVVQAESSVESLSGQVDTFGTELGNVEDLIPSTATPQNELADKAFVNSSIATNTANFLGTYTSLEQITAIANPTNNDYAFLQTVDQAGNTVYQRYKYNATQSSWLFEYSLNNSSFTAEQWATINSGLTQNLVDTAIANAVNGAISDEVIARNQAIATAISNALDSLDVASVGGSGKYIESISQVDGAIVPVEATIADEVTSGNMQSVTSNAVAEALSYSETEHQVGTWIDGSPLYERTIVERVSANGSYSFSIPTNHKVKFWTGNFFQDSITNPNWIMKIPYTFIDANNNTKYLVIYCYVDPNNHSFNFKAYGTYESSYYNGYAVITYKYTKG